MALFDSAASSSIGSPPGSLAQFLLLAKSASGAAAKSLVEQAVGAADVYVFSELLACPKIAELANSSETKPHHDLLKLFAYGTYTDFVAARHSLPPLTDPMQLKLRQLTIVSLAARSRRISYEQLMTVLHLKNVRELEDVVIDAVYKGVLKGKLDQKDQLLEVEAWQGRDAPAEQTADMLAVLTEWTERTQCVLTDVELKMQRANENRSGALKQEEKVENEVANLKKTLKMNASSSMRTTPDLDDPTSEVTSSRGGAKRAHRVGLRGSKPVTRAVAAQNGHH